MGNARHLHYKVLPLNTYVLYTQLSLHTTRDESVYNTPPGIHHTRPQFLLGLRFDSAAITL